MVCPSCKSEALPGIFCPICGARLQKTYRDVYYDTATLYRLFKDEYERYHPYKQIVDEILVTERSHASRIKASKSILPVLVFIIIGIFLAQALIFAIIAVPIMIATRTGTEVTETQITLQSIALVAAFLLLLFFTVLSIKLFRRSKRRAAANDETRLAELRSVLVDYYDLAEAPLLPLGLSNPYHIYNLSEIVRLGRAHTINEAIEVYMEDTEMDRRILEEEAKANTIRSAALVMAGIYAYKKIRDSGKTKIYIEK